MRNSRSSRWRRHAGYAGALALFLLVYADWLFGPLRFRWAWLNVLVVLVASLAPGVAVLLAPTARRRLRPPAFLLTLPFAAVGGIVALLAMLELASGLDSGGRSSMRPLDSFATDTGVLRAYLAWCPGSCGARLVVREETPLPLGLVLVRRLWERPHADGGRLVPVDGGVRVMVREAGRGESPGPTLEFPSRAAE